MAGVQARIEQVRVAPGIDDVPGGSNSIIFGASFPAFRSTSSTSLTVEDQHVVLRIDA
jgi:hypothetical protein